MSSWCHVHCVTLDVVESMRWIYRVSFVGSFGTAADGYYVVHPMQDNDTLSRRDGDAPPASATPQRNSSAKCCALCALVPS